MNTKTLGNKGEQSAAEYLKNKGYEIVTCNFRTRYGEIDIIAKDMEVLVFVEVKLRSSRSHGRGIEAVTPYKVEKIHQVALEYIQSKYQCEPACRFDVIEIVKSNQMEILHIKNAF